MHPSLGVIGLGRMGQALLLPLLERKEFSPEEVFAVVGKTKSVQLVSGLLPAGLKVVDSTDVKAKEVWKSPVQLLAVKPNQLDLVKAQCSEIDKTFFTKRPLLISLLAGVSLKRLQESFPNHACVRAIPNAPAIISAGVTGLAWGDGITPEQHNLVRKIFDPVSEVIDLPEDQMDAFLALTSSGPAYIAIISEALSDGAVAAGLPRVLASELTLKTIEGTALLLKKKGLHPAELKDLVASPGGTTISAIRHLEGSALRSALIEAVVVAAERSREMS